MKRSAKHPVWIGAAILALLIGAGLLADPVARLWDICLQAMAQAGFTT